MSLTITITVFSVSNVKVFTRNYYAFQNKNVNIMCSSALDGRVWFNWNIAIKLRNGKLQLVVVSIIWHDGSNEPLLKIKCLL